MGASALGAAVGSAFAGAAVGSALAGAGVALGAQAPKTRTSIINTLNATYHCFFMGNLSVILGNHSNITSTI